MRHERVMFRERSLWLVRGVVCRTPWDRASHVFAVLAPFMLRDA